MMDAVGSQLKKRSWMKDTRSYNGGEAFRMDMIRVFIKQQNAYLKQN